MRKEPAVLTCTVRWPEGMLALPSESQFSRPSDPRDVLSEDSAESPEALWDLPGWGWSCAFGWAAAQYCVGELTSWSPACSFFWSLLCGQNTLSWRSCPGGPEVRTLCFHCRGHRFDPWWENRSHKLGCKVKTNNQTKTHSLWLDRELKESPSKSRPLLPHGNIVRASSFLVSKFYRQKRNRWNKFNMFYWKHCVQDTIISTLFIYK